MKKTFHELEAISCAICLEDTTYVNLQKRVVKPKWLGHSHTKAARLKCGHIFHQTCIKKWYASKSPWESEDRFGNDCPCCRQSIRFRGVSFNYNMAIIEFAYSEEISSFESEYELADYYADIRYIYYDNPGICLFINNIKVCMIHFCFFFFFVKLT